MRLLAPFARVHLNILQLSLFVCLLLLPALALADGSQSYTSPGTYTFTVPTHGTLTVTVNGAGGGGGSSAWLHEAGNPGSAGTASGFGNITAGGGGGGGGEQLNCSANTGSSGGASGGSMDQTGGGSAGGAGGPDEWSICGSSHGGGSGGNGGLASITYGAGQLGEGSAVTVTVGSGGSGASAPGSQYASGSPGSSGSNGSVSISWTSPPAPTCSVNLSPNPSAYSYTGTPVTLSWSSSNADAVYINTVDSWEPSASGAPIYVASQSSTDYSCIGYSAAYGYGAWYSASLTVNPPPAPTLGISANPTSVSTGQTSTITATYAAGSGDSREDTALNEVPPGGGEFTIPGYGYTPPVSTYTYPFSTMTPGTYTFKPYIITSYYTSWSTEGQSVNVTVTQPPTSCTLSASPQSISQGGSSTLTWSSANATSCTGTNFSTGGATSGSASVSPTQTTTYTGSCTGAGGTASCNGGTGTTVSVTCTPSTVYSCSSSNVVEQTTTNASCNVTVTNPYQTCASPQFCSAGSNQCLYPVISLNPSGPYTGQLQLIPSLVSPGESTQVHWNVSNAQSCTVTGTNGDSWTGLSSPAGGETSKPITTQTIYTLSCQAYGTNPSLKESETVNVTPVYLEK